MKKMRCIKIVITVLYVLLTLQGMCFIFSTNKDINWEPYLRKAEQQIKDNWQPPKSNTSNKIVAKFAITKNGQVIDKEIVKSSNSKEADQAALNAIDKTAPFEHLPKKFKGGYIPIEFTFDYKMPNEK